jgi:F420-dependent oxidoreductase-like protein
MPFSKPLARTREYVKIMRDVWAREAPVTNDGPHYRLPIPNGTGLGKPLKPSIHPVRSDIPIFLAAEGPKNIALGAEICDGWMAMLLSPHHQEIYREALAEGFARPGARRSADDFEVAATVPMIVSADVEAAADALRHYYALYFGGMGAKGTNFHANVPIRMGYGEMVETVQDLYLSGKKQEAAAAIPFELIDQLSLIGPPEKIRDDLEAWRDSFVTTLLVAGDVNLVRTAAELVLG